ncbi:MAG: hypothetical protein R8F63_02205 [Acidimicrobiales bacterium]|nr:hypothetical protein [Acidimicrobiales bacterium]
MSSDSLDSAIDLVADDVEDLSNPVIFAIAQRGDGFDDACNRLSVRPAERLVDGELDFHGADGVMNWVWSYITAALVDGASLPEPAFSIYDAIDAGEYHHRGDGAEVDPVEKYTMPALRKILAKL